MSALATIADPSKVKLAMNHPTTPHAITVLLVGDVVAEDRTLLGELSRWGYQAQQLHASSTAELIAAVDLAPDLVLSGIHNASLGFDTVQRILRERGSHAGLIIVCDESDEERALEYLHAGADDMLFKNHLNRLGFITAQILNRRQMATRLAQDQLYIELLHESVGLVGEARLPQDHPHRAWAEKNGQPSAHARALANLAGRLSASLDLEQVLAALCAETTQALDSTSAIVFLYDENEKKFLPAHCEGLPAAEWVQSAATALEVNRKWAWIDQTMAAIPRPSDGARLPGSLLRLYWCEQRLLLAGMVYQGRWIGALGIPASNEDSAHDEDACALLQAFASQAAIAIANVRFYQRIRNRATELENLAQISSSLRRARTLAEIVPLLITATMDALHADRGALVFLTADRFIQAAAQELPTPDPIWSTRISQVAAQRALFGNRIYFSDTHTHSLGGDGNSTAARPSYALVLLRSVEEPIGVLCLGFDHPHLFELDEKRLLVAVAEMAGNAIHRTSVMDTLEQRVQVRTRELEALYEISGFTNQPIDIDRIIEKCLDKVLEVFHVQIGMIQLLSEDKKSLILAAQRGIPRHNMGIMDRVPLDSTIWNDIITKNRSKVSFDFCADAYIPDQFRFHHPPIFLGSPIHVRGEMLGAVSIFRDTAREFSIEETALLETIADQIGVAIDSARVRLRTEETAIQEERQRLARDLHDSVTQSLYSLSLMAEGYRRHARDARPEELDGWFIDLGNAAHQALKDMRLLLYELRPSSLQMDGIVVALNRRLEAVEERSEIATHFKIEGNLQLLDKREEVELYHIAQEALNNSLKHANAARIEIRLAVQRKKRSLEITDDGIGFDATQIHSAGMGLLNMIDRAKKMNGSLFIHSWPGKGTRIEFYREDKEEPAHADLDRR